MEIILEILNISLRDIIKFLLFGFAAFIGMFIAYIVEYSKVSRTIGLWEYLTGNKQAKWRALVALGTYCIGAGSLDYLDTLEGMKLLIAGAGIGFLVPQKTQLKQVNT